MGIVGRNVAGWTRIAIVARKDIEPHEELTYDYQVPLVGQRLPNGSAWLFAVCCRIPSFAPTNGLDAIVAPLRAEAT
jgi:hypothetical protein